MILNTHSELLIHIVLTVYEFVKSVEKLLVLFLWPMAYVKNIQVAFESDRMKVSHPCCKLKNLVLSY